MLADFAWGLAVGLALGATGGGGSILTVPILVYAIREPIHAAIGTSLAVVGGIALQGAIAQRQRVKWKLGTIVGLCGIVGSIGGTMLSQLIPGKILLLLFAAVMLAAALAMLFVRLPDNQTEPQLRWLPTIGAGTALGFLTGFLGVGGGFLIVPMLVFGLRFPLKFAIATSLLVIFLNTFESLLTRIATATIDWPVVALFLAGGIAGNYLGAAIARGLDQRKLKTIFACFVIAIGLVTGGSAIDLIPISVK